MHRAERQVQADDHQPEVHLAELVVVELPGDHRPPVIGPGEQAEDGTAEQHVVEVGDDVVRVGLLVVGRDDGVRHARQAADGELADEGQGEQHGRLEPQVTAPGRGQPVEDLHAGGYGDEHRRGGEGRVGHRPEADGEHVVGPHPPAHEADGDPGEHHHRIAEQRFSGKDRQHLGDDAHGREDEDVDLGVAEEPEQVLPQHRVTAQVGVEEVRAEVAVEVQLEQGHGDDRDGEEQQEAHHQVHPHEDRHPHERHARRPQVERGDDEVRRRRQRTDTGDDQAHEPEVDAVTGVELPDGLGGVAEPAAVGGTAEEEAGVQQQAAGQEHPVPEGVQPGEGDVAGADQDGHEVVTEGGRQRHDHQEHHGGAVHGEELVVLVGGQDLPVGGGQLHPDHQRFTAADAEEQEGGDAVEDADPLVVDRRDPAPEAVLALGSGERAGRSSGHRHGHSGPPFRAAAAASVGGAPPIPRAVTVT